MKKFRGNLLCQFLSVDFTDIYWTSITCKYVSIDPQQTEKIERKEFLFIIKFQFHSKTKTFNSYN